MIMKESTGLRLKGSSPFVLDVGNSYENSPYTLREARDFWIRLVCESLHLEPDSNFDKDKPKCRR